MTKISNNKKSQLVIKADLIGKTISNQFTPKPFKVEDTPEFRKAAKVYKLDVFEVE